MRARLRLLHPYPSLLNGVAVLAMALVAGAMPVIAIRLAAAMSCLQFAIGAFNDVADAPRDGGHVPPKPIPAGLVTRSTAIAVATAAAAAGLALTVPSGAPALAVAAAGLGCGLAYDAGLSRTAISWLPLAIALPLVPAYAWLGATGTVPAAILAVVPIGTLAGGGLAVGNALVDLETDRAAGRRTVAVALGLRSTWLLQSGLLGLAALLAVGLMPAGPVVLRFIAAFGGGLLLMGAAAMAPGERSRRRLGWQLEAAGVAILGLAWVMAAAGAT